MALHYPVDVLVYVVRIRAYFNLNSAFERALQRFERLMSSCNQKPCLVHFGKLMEAFLNLCSLCALIPHGLEFVEGVNQYKNVVGTLGGQLRHTVFQETRKRLWLHLCVFVVLILAIFSFDARWYIVFELPKDLSEKHSGDVRWFLVFYRMIETEVQNSEARGTFELLEDDGTDALENPSGKGMNRRYDFPAPAERMCH
jgi:hypothetical protein